MLVMVTFIYLKTKLKLVQSGLPGSGLIEEGSSLSCVFVFLQIHRPHCCNVSRLNESEVTALGWKLKL